MAFIFERSLLLLGTDGDIGLIVPISLICTQRMSVLQQVLNTYLNSFWLSNYAERPSKLFSGAEVLLTIAIGNKAKNSRLQSSTGFIKWTSEERKTLFASLSYAKVPQKPKPYVLPKVCSRLEISILNKLENHKGQLGYHFQRTSENRIYYRIGGGRYWKIFTNFQPRFVLNGEPSISSRENYLFFESKSLRDAAIAVLSTSLFYWYFILTTNCRDLNPSDLKEFPVSFEDFSAKNISELSGLCKKLMDDYSQNSQFIMYPKIWTGD